MSSYGFVKKSGRFGNLIVISKAVRCGPDNFWDPCDQVALLNALKELEWLTPFDEGSHATSSARTWEGAGAYGTRIRMQLYLECYCACRRHQGCHCMKRRLRYVAAFVGQLSDKPLLASIWLCGVSDVKNNGGLRNYALI